MLSLIRDKFDILIISGVFLVVFFAFVSSPIDEGARSTLRDILIALSGAFLTALGLRPRPNQTFEAETIRATRIDQADTQSGDIIVGKPKGTNNNEDI